MRTSRVMLWLPLTIALMLAGACKPRSVETPSPSAAAEVAWGKPINGLRLGLSPGKMTLTAKQRSFSLVLHYQNVGQQTVGIPPHKELFLRWPGGYLQLTKARQGGKRSLQPGGEVTEDLVIVPEEVGLGDDPERGETIMLRAGVRKDAAAELPKLTSGWHAPTTLKTDAVAISREDRAEK